MSRPPNTAIILTARSESARMPGKVLEDVVGKPLLYWIIKRLSEAGSVVLAVPQKDRIGEWGKAEGIQVYEGSMNDVTDRIWSAVNEFHPHAPFIMRGLGDCPFIVPELIKRSVEVMRENNADAFCWALPPFTNTIYGASEFPRSRNSWQMAHKESIRDEREHTDLYYHRNRDKFNIVYHEPPSPKFFRPYRLEVDWREDMELIRSIANHFGRLPTTEEAIDYLDAHDDWKVNLQRVERTGLIVSYRQKDRAMWWRIMMGKPVVLWNDKKIELPQFGEPIYCKAKSCLLGHTHQGKLYRLSGEVIEGDAQLVCACGAGRHWYPAS